MTDTFEINMAGALIIGGVLNGIGKALKETPQVISQPIQPTRKDKTN